MKKLFSRFKGGGKRGELPLQSEALHETFSQIASANQHATSEEAALILRDIFSTPESSRVILEIRSDGITLERDGSRSFHALDSGHEDEIEEEIRLHIARKISVLAPVLAQEQKHFLLLYVIRVLKSLAADQVTRVRQIIAEELRDSIHAPPEIIQKLARDEMFDVASPVLEYSPLLSDYELLDIIASANNGFASQIIAKRSSVSPRVSDAIIGSRDEIAIFELLRNPRANLSPHGIERVAAIAENHEPMHEPLVYRPELTAKTVNRIASFISMALLRDLEERGNLRPELIQDLKLSVSQRLQNTQLDRQRSAENEATELFNSGALDSETLLTRIENGEVEFVLHALALRSHLGYNLVRKMIDSANPRVVVSLCWRAGLEMRDSIPIQLRLAQIHHKDALYARHGIDYPLSEEKMREYVEFFA